MVVFVIVEVRFCDVPPNRPIVRTVVDLTPPPFPPLLLRSPPPTFPLCVSRLSLYIQRQNRQHDAAAVAADGHGLILDCGRLWASSWRGCERNTSKGSAGKLCLQAIGQSVQGASRGGGAFGMV